MGHATQDLGVLCEAATGLQALGWIRLQKFEANIDASASVVQLQYHIALTYREKMWASMRRPICTLFKGPGDLQGSSRMQPHVIRGRFRLTRSSLRPLLGWPEACQEGLARQKDCVL